MTLYFAPLEGVTDAVFRRIHHECFPGVSKYFIPFISPTQNLAFTSRDWAAIAPENNIGVPAVPQLLAKDASLFLWGDCQKTGTLALGSHRAGSQFESRLSFRHGDCQGQGFRSFGQRSRA